MEDRELHTPSMSKIFLFAVGLGLIPIFLFNWDLNFSENFFINFIIRFGLLIMFGIYLVVVSAKFSVDDLPKELNNLVNYVGIGVFSYTALFIFIPPFMTAFAIIYLLYFISKIDENNKILYNDKNELDVVN